MTDSAKRFLTLVLAIILANVFGKVMPFAWWDDVVYALLAYTVVSFMLGVPWWKEKLNRKEQ